MESCGRDTQPLLRRIGLIDLKLNNLAEELA
jgi:hypothetical protein